MSFWKNPTESDGRVVLLYGDSGPSPLTVEIKAGEVGFIPDMFDYAISSPSGAGLAPAWVRCDAPAVAAAITESATAVSSTGMAKASPRFAPKSDV